QGPELGLHRRVPDRTGCAAGRPGPVRGVGPGPGFGRVGRRAADAGRCQHGPRGGRGGHRGWVSGLWLLEGMAADGVLTTIDIEVEHQRAAKEAFAAAGVRSTRTRCISGRGLDVLPKLADSAYDMVFLDAAPDEAGDYADQAIRMLRPGGILAVAEALWHDRVADPARRDETTVAMREVGRTLREREDVAANLLPVGGGLLVAITS